MKKDDLEKVTTSGSEASPSRRRLLKALTAGGAAAAAAPAEWTKPALNAVMLPAHAQTTPDGEPPAGGDDCKLNSIAAWGLVTSFCSSITVVADGDCGAFATVNVRRDGELLVQCTNQTAAFGVGGNAVSWSCSGNSNVDVLNGQLVTFDVQFSGGCSCRFVVAAD